MRLLLDDNDTSGLDTVLAALDAHPNFDIRLFNPFKLRRLRLLGYVTDFARLNRRMHNKSFTADDQVTIIGGRNIGDEYFAAGRAASFVDLDVLAIGQVVKDVSRDFDRYWASASAIPLGRVLRGGGPRTPTAVALSASRAGRPPSASADANALPLTPRLRHLLTGDRRAGRRAFEWATTHMLSDDPRKGLRRTHYATLLWPRLRARLRASTHVVRLVSPYFVPGRAGVEALTDLAAKGVKIAVLTNSLEATDVALVHAGYAKRRRRLLGAGIALFELKRASSQPPATKRPGRRPNLRPGSSGSSLHAKTFAVDDAQAFIGSFNFDPRSASLNTEMGFLIESPVLAGEIVRKFFDEVPTRAYELRLNGAGRLRWIERRNGDEIVHADEPGTTRARRIALALLSLLPIEWLL